MKSGVVVTSRQTTGVKSSASLVQWRDLAVGHQVCWRSERRLCESILSNPECNNSNPPDPLDCWPG